MRSHFIPRLSFLAAALLSASAFAQIAAPLPANIVADQAAVAQRKAALQAAIDQLKADRPTARPSSLTDDRAAIGIARMQYGEALRALQRDAENFLQADRSNLMNALNQVRADHAAANAAAASADEAAVASAQQQLKADLRAVYQGMGTGKFGEHGRQWGM